MPKVEAKKAEGKASKPKKVEAKKASEPMVEASEAAPAAGMPEAGAGEVQLAPDAVA